MSDPETDQPTIAMRTWHECHDDIAEQPTVVLYLDQPAGVGWGDAEYWQYHHPELWDWWKGDRDE